MTDPLMLKLAENIGAAGGTDYFLMKEQLTRGEQDMLYSARKFWRTEVLLIITSYWERATFHSNPFPRAERHHF
jgi:glutaryl-CoA dehydrogenase